MVDFTKINLMTKMRKMAVKKDYIYDVPCPYCGKIVSFAVSGYGNNLDAICITPDCKATLHQENPDAKLPEKE